MRTNSQKDNSQNIAVIFLGKPAPGAQNVIDGLLKYQSQRPHCKILGVVDGVDGLLQDKIIEITEENFSTYRNLGGIDFLRRSRDSLRTEAELKKLHEVCQEHNLTGLVMVGATHTMTDCAIASQYLLQNNCKTNLVAVPSTIDGNIHHKYIETSIGFDTASKLCSQLIGNMLTDSASAIKYWYFIKIMGGKTSHLTLECALRTHTNMVLLGEESEFHGETLKDIVGRICD